MSVKLVALDLDGTLVGRDLIIRPRVREAVASMLQRGVRGAIVTGRMYRASIGFARELEFDAPLVCYQGAAIVDPASDEVLRDVPLSADLVQAIAIAAAEHGMHLQLYRNDMYYCEARNRFSDLYASLAQCEPVIVPSLRETFTFSGATKAVVVADAEDARAYAERMSALLGPQAYVTRSYPEFVEILDPSVDKGDALRFVAGSLDIAMDEVMAIGDSWNDMPLLEAAGFGIAMGSGPAELRAKADAVVADVAHDGVAEAIERYVLGAGIGAGG